MGLLFCQPLNAQDDIFQGELLIQRAVLKTPSQCADMVVNLVNPARI